MFAATGQCKYGEACVFAHVVGDEAAAIEDAVGKKKQKKAEKEDRRRQKLQQRQQEAHTCSSSEAIDDTEVTEDGFEADFGRWITKKFQESQFYEAKKSLYDRAISIVLSWRNRFEDHPDIITRIMKGRGHRMLKEFEECVPVIEKTMMAVQQTSDESPSITIVDLCSGFGYLSMFLSDLLPPERISRIVLIDKQFPHSSAPSSSSAQGDYDSDAEIDGAGAEIEDRHINWSHMKGECASRWPIPLVPVRALYWILYIVLYYRELSSYHNGSANPGLLS